MAAIPTSIPAQQGVDLAVALSHAIERNELSLVYQPLVDLQTGRIAGVEALLRWKHPELGAVPPTEFIAVAENCGLIESIGEWVLYRACEDLQRWSANGFDELLLAVNVSPLQLEDPSFVDCVARVIQDTGIRPSVLSLEITENVLLQDACQTLLVRLREIGVGLVLDDFGTGFSSLGYLKRFRFDKVKIDRSFVEDIVQNPDDGAIAKAVISMAHSLGIRVVAEGVEMEPQCDFLKRNMCDEIQGYLFSRPIPAAELETMLREGHSLPERLRRFSKPPRTLLLVDDEVNIVSALKRLLRRDGYTIFTAHSGREGLDILQREAVDVIVSDQRMPGMTGVEFLSQAKESWPDTVRIVLSGFTELQSVTDAVNQGAIYKFLTKPWDDVQLRGHIEEAFRRKEMADENRRLTLEVQTANFELASANRLLGDVLDQQRQRIRRDEVSLDVVHEVLRHLPVPIVGLDDDQCIVFINISAQTLFAHGPLLLGSEASVSIPTLLQAAQDAGDGQECDVELNGRTYRAISHVMGQGSESRGRLITLFKCEQEV